MKYALRAARRQLGSKMLHTNHRSSKAQGCRSPCQAECRPAGVKIANVVVVVLHVILGVLVVSVALSPRRVAGFYRLLAGSSAWLQHMRLIKAAGAFGIRDALPNQNKPC